MHSVPRFPGAMVYLVVRRYSSTKSPYRSPNCPHTLSLSLCGVLGNIHFTSTDATNASSPSLFSYVSYRKLTSCVDPHMLSRKTPTSYSLCCILLKTTIHTSLTSVTAQHMGFQFHGNR